jgi:hypothetical protein
MSVIVLALIKWRWFLNMSGYKNKSRRVPAFIGEAISSAKNYCALVAASGASLLVSLLLDSDVQLNPQPLCFSANSAALASHWPWVLS